MALVQSPSYSHSHHSLIHASHDPSWASPSLSHADHACAEPIQGPEPAARFDLAAELNAIRIDGIGALSTLDSFGTLGILRPHEVEKESVPSSSRELRDSSCSESPSKIPPDPLEQALSTNPRHPFKKWMKSLHRRAALRPSVLRRRHLPLHLLEPSDVDRAALDHRQHRPSSSGSSYGFVAAVRSASVSLASVSSVTRSRRNTTRSRISRTERSSRASMSATRMSEDSCCPDRQPKLDLAAAERAIQRRRILEEIISTEEGYIRDIRFLINVYVTILASLPSQAVGLRSSINRNLTDIVELHEEILSELHRVVPDSEYTQEDMQPAIVPTNSHAHAKIHGHRRWRSLDAVPENEYGPFTVEQPRGLLADPQTAADVARIFGKRMNKFFIYKEYGAKYDMMTADIASAHANMPEWESYQKGLEALASTVASSTANTDELKKSLGLADLLMKPIQRICRYPLLFSELLKHTTVLDCPNSHMEVESTLTRLREATAEINRATDDPQVRATLEKTWLLQDRLVFPQRKLDAVTRNQIRSFGRIHLCGAIYVCWQTKTGVDGQYLVALLYQDVLCLASAGRVEPIYTILACISLDRAKIEEVDNGRGLQCHTAPFSWKIVFESDCELYEMIMTACSEAEAEEWCSRLKRPRKEGLEDIENGIFSSQELGMKSLGTIFGKHGTLARRLSIHRAITVTPKSPMCQVVVKNTSAIRDRLGSSSSTLAINRSQSLLTTNTRLPVLAPPRAERARLELLLSDVWSRDILPFPGITRPKNEHLVRASSVMRKISMASLTGPFNKRTSSVSRRGGRLCEEESAEANQVAAALQSEDCVVSQGDATDPTDARDNDATIKVKRPRVHETVTCPAEAPRKPPTPTMEEATETGTVRRAKAEGGLEKTVSQDSGRLDPRTMQVLRKSSTNSLCLTPSVPSVKAATVPMEKENMYESTGVKPARRWHKVSKSRGADKVHNGLRNFFR